MIFVSFSLKKIVRGGLVIPNILQNIAPAIKSAIARYHHLDKRGECANDYVIAQGNRAFCITDNFECYEVEKYYGGGLNVGVPLGSLEMTEGMPALRAHTAGVLRLSGGDGQSRLSDCVYGH